MRLPWLIGILGVAALAVPVAVVAARSDEVRTSSVTVLPVRIGGGMRGDVAAVIGGFCERGGVDRVELAKASLSIADESSFVDAVGALSRHVREHPVETEHALFAWIVGTHKTGVQAVRTAVVDRAGALVWCDHQRPGDPRFDRSKPRNPMTCAQFVWDGYRERFGIRGPGRTDGPIAKAWAARSGVPPKAERAAIADRREAFAKAGANARVAVSAVQVGAAVDPAAAKTLVDLLNAEHACAASLGSAAPHMKLEAGPNQQKRLWDFARSVQRWVRANPPAADYSLHAEYVFAPDGRVWGVHVVLCDRGGEWVVVELGNSHHADFQRIAPASRADCGKLVAARLASR